jgi:hypothetical protein
MTDGKMESYTALTRLVKSVLTEEVPDSMDVIQILEDLVPIHGISGATQYEVADDTIHLISRSPGGPKLSVMLDGRAKIMVSDTTHCGWSYIDMCNPDAYDLLWAHIRQFYKEPYCDMQKHPGATDEEG